MALRKYMFLLSLIALFIGTNLFSLGLLSALISSEFLITLMTSIISGLSFLFTFVIVIWHYIPDVSAGFWAKFLLLALALFSFYAFLSLAVGEPLLRAMGFEVAPVLVGSNFPRASMQLSLFSPTVSHQ